MPAFSYDLIGTLLVAMIAVPAITLALRQLREQRRLEWLRRRMG